MVVDLRGKENLWHGPLTTWAATDTSKSTWIEQTELEDQKWCCVAEVTSRLLFLMKSRYRTCSARFGVLPVCDNSPIYFAVLSWGSVSVPEMPTDSQGQKHHWPKFGGVWVNEGQKVTEQTWTSHLPCSTPHLWGRLHYRYYLCYIFFINVLLTLMCINVLTLPLKNW